MSYLTIDKSIVTNIIKCSVLVMARKQKMLIII